MTYLQTDTIHSADQLDTEQSGTRLPYYLAVPIWGGLAVVAWAPLIVLFRAVVS